MTNEEAIAYFKRHIDLYCVDGICREAEETAIKALEQQPSDTVSRGAFEQVMWERDVAIEQLKELGYELGQKIEHCDDAISRNAVIQTLNKMDRYTATELTLCDTNKKFPANEVFIVDDVYEQIAEQLPSVTHKPIECDDAVSREDAEQMFRNIRCHLKPQDYKSAEEFNTRDLMLLNAEQMIHALPSVMHKSGKWISVSERLPENAKHKGAFCPKYYVMTEFGQTEGWYNPDVGCWYVLLWFMDARFETWNISLERGDVPKLVKNVPVTAWMPLPEPYEPQEGANE